VANVRGHIVLWNPAAEQLFGYATSEAVGRPVGLVIPDRLLAQHRAGFANFARTGHGPIIDSDEPVEVPARHKTGIEVPVELSLSVLEPTAAGGRFVLAIIRDATMRHRAEAQRAELIREQARRAEAEATQRRLAFLAEAGELLANSLEYERTLQSVLRLAVPALGDWCGIDLSDRDPSSTAPQLAAHVDPGKDELVRELQRRYPPDLQGHQPVAEVLRTGKSVLISEMSDEQLRATSRDRAHLALQRRLGICSILVVPLRARDRLLGALTCGAGDSGRRFTQADLDLAEDLARRCALSIDNARLYALAQRAVQERDQFFSIAAHELKTPITAFRARVQLMLRQLDRFGELDAARVRHLLDVADQQSGRLARLAQQLLDASRLEGGKLTLQYQDVDLVRLVQEVVAYARDQTDRHVLDVQAPPILHVRVDPLRLEQVVVNLIDNAVKYSPAGGAIDVNLSTGADGSIRLAVRDRGLGIPLEQRPRIFERFYQAHGEEHFGGLGLGLFISQQIVQLHGGEISLEAPADGGTRFVVTLPGS
jgi:PAS domain S-box-containing protein